MLVIWIGLSNKIRASRRDESESKKNRTVKFVIDLIEHPLELSLDLSEQVLIPADAWSIAYRRALADFGLTTGLEVKN